MPRFSRFLSLAAALMMATPLAAAAPTPDTVAKLPPIKHVFVITLENENAIISFGPDTQAPYLAKTLVAEGAFLPNYYGTGHASPDNYIAMESGQGANPMTRGDCQPDFKDFKLKSVAQYGQAVGTGCVFPKQIKTIGNQLAGNRLTWRGYMEDMGNDSARESKTCGPPVVNAKDG